jgi:hypothetical protein
LKVHDRSNVTIGLMVMLFHDGNHSGKNRVNPLKYFVLQTPISHDRASFDKPW